MDTQRVSVISILRGLQVPLWSVAANLTLGLVIISFWAGGSARDPQPVPFSHFYELVLQAPAVFLRKRD